MSHSSPIHRVINLLSRKLAGLLLFRSGWRFYCYNCTEEQRPLTCDNELSSSRHFAILRVLLCSSSLLNCLRRETLPEGLGSDKAASDNDFLPEPCCSITEARFCLPAESTKRWEVPPLSWVASFEDKRFPNSDPGPLLSLGLRPTEDSFLSTISTSTWQKRQNYDKRKPTTNRLLTYVQISIISFYTRDKESLQTWFAGSFLDPPNATRKSFSLWFTRTRLNPWKNRKKSWISCLFRWYYIFNSASKYESEWRFQKKPCIRSRSPCWRQQKMEVRKQL